MRQTDWWRCSKENTTLFRRHSVTYTYTTDTTSDTLYHLNHYPKCILHSHSIPSRGHFRTIKQMFLWTKKDEVWVVWCEMHRSIAHIDIKTGSEDAGWYGSWNKKCTSCSDDLYFALLWRRRVGQQLHGPGSIFSLNYAHWYYGHCGSQGACCHPHHGDKSE